MSEPGTNGGSEQAFALSRRQMVEELRRYGITDERVLELMARLPRHRFVPEPELPRAYADDPLPIGLGQTISQPYMVAVMTEHLALSGGERVLEIGTGSGYQTALLAELAGELFTIERLQPLLAKAQARLAELGDANVHYRVGDGSVGWPEEAPFDRILAAAATPALPSPWKEQLADGGRIVAPVGPRYGQLLMVYTKRGEQWEERGICPCVFVPLTGQFGWKEEEF